MTKSELDLKYKDKWIIGSDFIDDPYKIYPVKLTPTISNVYLPKRDLVMKDLSMGFKLLTLAQALQEGYYSYINDRGRRVTSVSFKTNNPGNIGNTDNGKKKVFETLELGVQGQVDYINLVASGKHKKFPLNTNVVLPPFYSEEIDHNPGYGLPCNLPGYKFLYTGQINQYVKIYATGPRAGNGYVNKIVSVYHQYGFTSVTPQSKIQDLIKLV